MANDPAFLFYPGDYLRDTQCLSEKTQVAYDRIMCEHMRNICITQKQLNFFTKRLSDDEKEELEMILKKNSKRYQIEWVAESIEKRRAYSESRRKNREGIKKKTSLTYEPHMEDESEDEIEGKKKKKESPMPPLNEFLEQAKTACEKANMNFNEFSFSIESKYETWVSDGWKDGHGVKIKNWKNKLNNILPHLRPIWGTQKSGLFTTEN